MAKGDALASKRSKKKAIPKKDTKKPPAKANTEPSEETNRPLSDEEIQSLLTEWSTAQLADLADSRPNHIVQRPKIIYHADCYDGFTAAWIAHKAFTGWCDLIPAKYGEDPPWDALDGRDVFVIDFSYKRDVMIEMNQRCRSLEVLAHHKTAQDECEGLDFCTFDMDRSGAGMAWDRFFVGRPRPFWISAVEDRDLWRWKVPNSAEIHAYMATMPMAIFAWSQIDRTPFVDLVMKGRAVMDSIERYCEKMSKQAMQIELFGQPAIVVNAPYLNCSELCHHLLEIDEESQIAVSYFLTSEAQWQFSLRSRKDGVDVGAIARSLGGGGHHSAAGFTSTEIPDFVFPAEAE